MPQKHTVNIKSRRDPKETWKTYIFAVWNNFKLMNESMMDYVLVISMRLLTRMQVLCTMYKYSPKKNFHEVMNVNGNLKMTKNVLA